jgi:hypothetical protein
MSSWKRGTVVWGAIFGAFGGMILAMLLVRRAEREGRDRAITPGEFLRLGGLLLGLFREVRTLGDGE